LLKWIDEHVAGRPYGLDDGDPGTQAILAFLETVPLRARSARTANSIFSRCSAGSTRTTRGEASSCSSARYIRHCAPKA